jgi:cytochrome b pre-mRNA-processing protein 3
VVDGGQAEERSWWERVAGGVRSRRATRRARRETAHALYHALVTQAREPAFYAELGVPDTREGRLEMVMLHAILVVRRLRAEGEAGRELAQALFDLMFDDIDRHMREWGVGDLSVGKHVKRVAQTFYARAGALEPALEGDGDAVAALAPVLARNVYGRDEAAGEPRTRRLAGYFAAQAETLAGRPGADLLAGRLLWGPAATPAEATPPLPPPVGP